MALCVEDHVAKACSSIKTRSLDILMHLSPSHMRVILSASPALDQCKHIYS